MANTVSNLPNCVVIGAMKASTTTFYELLQLHPHVWFPADKEPHYFTSKRYGEDEAWNSYQRLFDDAPTDARVIGEASVRYTTLPRLGPTPQRLRDKLGNPRLIYLIRDPVDRLISNFRHVSAIQGYPKGTTLRRAMDVDPILVTASEYSSQISGYLEVFEPADLLVMTVEELHSDPASAMRTVEHHLSLEPFMGWPETLVASNSNQALKRSFAMRTSVSNSVFDAVRNRVPSSVRRKLLTMMPMRLAEVEVTDSDRKAALQAVADDLISLRQSLGDRIGQWPSVRRLGI